MAWIIFPVNLFTAMIRSLPRVMPENTEQVIAVFVPLYELANSMAPFAKLLFESINPKEYNAFGDDMDGFAIDTTDVPSYYSRIILKY